jgi:hypothetical protein
MTQKRNGRRCGTATAARAETEHFHLADPKPKSQKSSPPGFASDGNGLPPALSGFGRCEGCGETSVLMPIHGGKGGPLRCPLCVGKWNAEHGRKRRTGRVVIRAIMAFYDAGGSCTDLDKLKNSAGMLALDTEWLAPEITDPLGYMDGVARMDGADADMTSELLADVLRLTHPDHHPPERQQLAHGVTQRLLALQPFVFPAPKPKKPLFDRTPRKDSPPPPSSSRTPDPERPPRFPCADCADAMSYEYCTACRAEYDRREQKEFERRTPKQRADYKRRRQRALARRPPRRCEACGAEFKRTRTDARYCSDTCRQRAHRKAVVTAKNSMSRETITSRDDHWGDRILALLKRRPAVFLNDLLPEDRTRAQYQALCAAAVKLEAAGKIDSWSYAFRYSKPGHKVLMRRGHKFEREPPRLLPEERLKLQTEPSQGGAS